MSDDIPDLEEIEEGDEVSVTDRFVDALRDAAGSRHVLLAALIAPVAIILAAPDGWITHLLLLEAGILLVLREAERTGMGDSV